MMQVGKYALENGRWKMGVGRSLCDREKAACHHNIRLMMSDATEYNHSDR
ncbi:hypothetical protein AB3R30_09275 [Leptolyngbyaceae cyanobacterium UHCC 1019]